VTAALLAGTHGPHHLPTGLLAAVIPVLALLLSLDAYCLINLARATSVRYLPKTAWVFVILLVSAPTGALLYLFFGVDRTPASRKPKPGLGRVAARPQPASIQTPPAGQAAAADGRRVIVTTTCLTRDYGGTGLFEVDLAVPRGSVYGLVGLNGAGKTTLLSILSGMRHPDCGSVAVAAQRLQIAVCPDVPDFDGWLTAYEVVDLARSLVVPSAGSQAVRTAISTVGLAGCADRRVGGFSRGMVQRLGLACALVGDPELLILDEPTSALDPAGRAELLDLVAGMRGSRTVIFSSHILADVQRVADEVGILRDGRLLYQGPTQDLIDTYLTPSWLVRLAGETQQVAAAMEAAGWATRVEPAGGDAIRVDAATFEAGERGIPAVIAGCGARQVACEPVAADLESAFLALTGAAKPATGVTA
jgi:ABC-2 type transport system ATP-binding protein